MTAMSPTMTAAVDTTMKTVMATGKQPGMMVSITSTDWGDYTQAYGLGKKAAPITPMNLNNTFRLDSVTKTFTATLVFQQIDAGHLSLSDKLNQYIPGVPAGDQITIQNLLMMRSGVFDYEQDPQVKLYSMVYPSYPWNENSLLAVIKNNPSQFTPGSQYAYTNSNHILLGLILEQITGQSYQTLVTNLIASAGLTHTALATKAGPPPVPYANGYNPVPFLSLLFGPALSYDTTVMNPGLFGAAGAITSTIGDLNKWGQALRDGLFVSGTSQTLRTTTFAAVPYSLGGPNEFGYGLGQFSFGTWIGHNGSGPGYGCCVMYEKNSGTVIAVMENLQTNGLAAFSQAFYRLGLLLYPDSMVSPGYPSS